MTLARKNRVVEVQPEVQVSIAPPAPAPVVERAQIWPSPMFLVPVVVAALFLANKFFQGKIPILLNASNARIGLRGCATPCAELTDSSTRTW